jgi:hypothetical protein
MAEVRKVGLPTILCPPGNHTGLAALRNDAAALFFAPAIMHSVPNFEETAFYREGTS